MSDSATLFLLLGAACLAVVCLLAGYFLGWRAGAATKGEWWEL